VRHRRKGRKLGRDSAHRKAMFSTMAGQLFQHGRIRTTEAKAKELRPIAEKVITRGKHGTVHDRRWVLSWILSRDLVKKVFDEIAPRFTSRPGGYLRIVKLGPRQGDGAEMAVLELVERPEAAAAEPAPETPKPKRAPRPKKEASGDAKPKPKKEAKGDGKKVHTQKEGRSQTSKPKKIGA